MICITRSHKENLLAALKPGPNGEDPHEETGIMTKTDSQQTMVITQKT